MTVYILRSKTSVYVFTSIFETRDFWLAPSKDGEFSIFGKDVFTLEIEQAHDPQKSETGFKQ